MFAETIIGYIDFVKNKIPLRNFEREANVSSNLALLLHSIDYAQDRASKKRELCDLITRYSLWNEGEKIIGVIEEAMVNGQDTAGKEIQLSRPQPLTRDTFEHVIDSVATKATLSEIDVPRIRQELPPGPYAFDLLIYEPEQNRLRAIHMLYGVAAQEGALGKWYGEATFGACLWDRLGRQYFGIEDALCEFALIDPLLNDSLVEDGIWALADLDRLIGKPGLADKALNVQEALREEVTLWLGDVFAKSQADQERLIDEAFVEIALQAIDSLHKPNYRILTPRSESP
ncbi:hypothetical protein GCM10011385_40430 [Nitratireductor aestuarii]|uniref:Uncharacterized protein n=1 Tax=Nitratireductor aestuarii TaxID=1735103 RepID=A0A916S363_9HYPH|nr:hypothetical protein [Nitratireductor aestuarii]GGA82120.1 hypothetical protein GCM10011385_40430 [Nitratireductor aestuarii]